SGIIARETVIPARISSFGFLLKLLKILRIVLDF
ncbi:MAG: hypothetical protein ACI9LF_002196, partial [Flavobacteriales bacterium]